VSVGSVVVLGAGVSGMAAALLLARAGHRVTLIERDGFDVGAAEDAPRWLRRGIPHFLQPHALIPRARAELMASLPDVYASLLEAGARDVDLRPKLPAAPTPQDEDLQYLGVRRPVLEWAMRRAVGNEPLIEVHPRVRPTGVQLSGGWVRGVDLPASSMTADLVVDALGRRTPTDGWLAGQSVACRPVQSSECGVVYYSRYFRQRPGFELPDGPWLLSPRGDLGYLGFASFPGDSRTFAAVLAVPTGVPAWRAFRDAEVFGAAVERIPALRSWVDPDGVEPITDVLAMANLHNTLRDAAAPTSVGVVPVGDAYAHSDPVLAHGLAFGLIHARELVLALTQHADLPDALDAYRAATEPALKERYELATALDDQRHRLWLGERVDFAHRTGAYALFSIVAAGAAATLDADVFRTAVRRSGLLDSTGVLDRDDDMQRRIEELFADLVARPAPPSGPTVDEMLSLVEGAHP
jgi:2-polyprenyl-6-methoxyphenol hydroxylase-like FAD-dependent oxidoreductase